MKVTFDTNVFQQVVRPDLFPKDPDASLLAKINAAIKAGTVRPFVVETTFDLDAIMKMLRPTYFGKPKTQTHVNETVGKSGEIALSFTLGPKKFAHPGLAPILKDRLTDAIAIGFRVLYAPRVGLPKADEIDLTWFETAATEKENQDRLDRFFTVLRAIEARTLGIERIKAIAAKVQKHEKLRGPWYAALHHAKDPTDVKEIERAIAEWADADSVAAHVGYANDLYCTRDKGKSAGAPSIMDTSNREWLSKTFGVKFVTPAELALEV